MILRMMTPKEQSCEFPSNTLLLVSFYLEITKQSPFFNTSFHPCNSHAIDQAAEYTAVHRCFSALVTRYLQCRMDRNLMRREPMKSLGFTEEAPVISAARGFTESGPLQVFGACAAWSVWSGGCRVGPV